MITAHVGVDAGGPGDRSQHAVVASGARGQAAGALETVGHERVAEAEGDDLVEVADGGVHFAGDVDAGRRIDGHAARHEATAQQAIAGDALVEPQQPLADPEAVRMGHGEARVVGDHAEIRHVVVEAFQLEKHDAQVAGPVRLRHPRRRLERLAEGQRVAHARVAGDALGQAYAVGRPAALEQLLGALVGEVEAHLHVDDRLAQHAEPEVPRLDHAGVHRPHRDLVDALAAHLLEREGLAIVVELARARVLAQREPVGRPEPVAHERARIGMAHGGDAEEIGHLPLEARGRVVARRQRAHGRRGSVERRGGMHEPVGTRPPEEIVRLEGAALGPPVARQHQAQLGAEVAGEEPAQRRDRVGRQRAVQLAPAHDPNVARGGHRDRQRRRQRVRQAHGATIATMRTSRPSTAAGSVRPSTTSAARQPPSGTSAHRLLSPSVTAAGGRP